ncbi:TerD family protein [Nocardia sp. NPDC059764]|uniref:TerD family protein n=1 Tax=Nocardia sp. NPDC059764 TaxID=3346939 RepID=UPI0036669E99
MNIEDIVVRRTLRIPAPEGTEGDGAVAVRQFDAALMSVGFKLSDELFTTLGQLSTGVVIDTAVRVLPIVRHMVGDHVEHNVYFREFPKNVPDTIEFWTECLLEALADPTAAVRVAAGTTVFGSLDLLSLPAYGRYRHSYTDMLAAHDEFIEGAGDRVTVLHAGRSLTVEANRLYRSMAAATTPGNDTDREDLAALALACARDAVQPSDIPVRENRALINAARIAVAAAPLLTTVTDVLRLACALSGGDVTLTEPTRFRGMRRPVRRALLAGLHEVVSTNPAAAGDVHQYREQWKRLGERLHPHEYPQYPSAADVFAVARREKDVPSLASKVERLIYAGEPDSAAALLQRSAPGTLHRSADRLLRTSQSVDDQRSISYRIAESATQVSGRVLLSLREHLDNPRGARRVFVNQSSRGHVIDDYRASIAPDVLDSLKSALEVEIRRRLPGNWVIDPDMLDVALPISGKTAAGGFGTLPRGSRTPITAGLLRFFVYWRQTQERTDFDLSALMCDKDFRNARHISYTNLRDGGGCHSGDITSAPDGASEFIDLDLSKMQSDIVIPQVNVYSGEGFEEVAESFFGFMQLDAGQMGKPFEARAVRMKSELRGAGRVALPMVFVRTGTGWEAVWTHLHLTGSASFNQVENNRAATSTLIGAILDRKYLTVRHLAALTDAVIGMPDPDGPPVTYVGLEAPEGIPAGSTVIKPTSLRDLIPA